MACAKEIDPISAFLKCQFVNRKHSQLNTEDGEKESSIDSCIIASARRILENKVEFEKSPAYSTAVAEKLKGKYKVLVFHKKTNVTTESNKAQVRSSTGLSPKKLYDMGISNKKMGVDSMHSPPVPSTSLFPENGIKLGWTGNEPVGAGMLNLGNTCYLNSTLQALFHIPSFCNWLSSESVHNGSGKCDQAFIAGEMCTICAMAATLRVSKGQTGHVIKPALIYSRLRSICKHLCLGQQEDAHEFLRFLIESMERTFLLRYKGKKLDNLSKETTPLHRIFGGYLRNEVICHSCGRVSTTFQLFQDIFLDIRHADTLSESMKAFFSREKLEGGEGRSDCYKCEKCRNRGNCSKRVYIQMPPKVLCIQLKRFTALGKKIMKHITYPLMLDLSPYVYNEVSSQQNPCTIPQNGIVRPIPYKLVSVVSHYGTALNCGHYTAIGISAKGTYFSFDDSQVRPVSLSSALGGSAYILMYEMEPNWYFSETKRNLEKVDTISAITSPVKRIETNIFQKSQTFHPQVKSGPSPKMIMLPSLNEKSVVDQLVPKPIHSSPSKIFEPNHLKPAPIKMKSLMLPSKNILGPTKVAMNGMVDAEKSASEAIAKVDGIPKKEAEDSSTVCMEGMKHPVAESLQILVDEHIPPAPLKGSNTCSKNVGELVPSKSKKNNNFCAVEKPHELGTSTANQQTSLVSIKTDAHCSKESTKISSPKSKPQHSLKRSSSFGSEESRSSACKKQLTLPDIFRMKNKELAEKMSSQPKIRTLKDWLVDRKSTTGVNPESKGKQSHIATVCKSWSVNGWRVTDNASLVEKVGCKRKRPDEDEAGANKRKRFNKFVNSELLRTLSQSKIPFLNSNCTSKNVNLTEGKEGVNGISSPLVSLGRSAALFQKM